MSADTKIGFLSTAGYGRFLLFIAGMGGLLYGIDVGIISAALLYLGKTVTLSLEQQSMIAAAVFAGSMVGSLGAGFLADWLGRRTMMMLSGFLFVSSVIVIVLSNGFGPLFAGRLLQGVSGGVIAVVVPLYLAECLSAKTRGRGSAIFQLMLTVGIVIAAGIGWFYTRQAEAAVTAAAGNAALIRVAQNHAWRGMFLSVMYPGLVFFVGCFFVSESPRWLFRKGRKESAMAALLRASGPDEAALQFREMELTSVVDDKEAVAKPAGSLLQRKYVVPFLLACTILICNQTTGINSILTYLAVILKQAGMSTDNATQWDFWVKLLNCGMTVVAVALVDRKGRKFLLMLGTGGIVVALLCGALVFHGFESKRLDIKSDVQAEVRGNALELPAGYLASRYSSRYASSGAMELTVLYSYGNGDQPATALSTEGGGALEIHPMAGAVSGPLVVKHALYGPLPDERTGLLVALCVAMFIASFAVGPGVVVWLTLSELMPTRIRSGGMGIALVLNQAASTVIAGVFLPVVGGHGYALMFVFWTGCTLVYFLTAAFWLPETKGKTLEEIELLFAAPKS